MNSQNSLRRNKKKMAAFLAFGSSKVKKQSTFNQKSKHLNLPASVPVSNNASPINGDGLRGLIPQFQTPNDDGKYENYGGESYLLSVSNASNLPLKPKASRGLKTKQKLKVLTDKKSLSDNSAAEKE